VALVRVSSPAPEDTAVRPLSPPVTDALCPEPVMVAVIGNGGHRELVSDNGEGGQELSLQALSRGLRTVV
jgi:hypothetical protein